MTRRRLDEQVESQTSDPLDRRLSEALEAAPHIAVADDFAARVMSRVPARRIWAQNVPAHASVGRRVALIAAAVLLLAMLGFAAPSPDANQLARTAAEWIVAAEFVALTLWLSLRTGTLR